MTTSAARIELNKKKVLSAVATVFTALIVALTAYVVISIIVARVQNKDVNLFGYSMGIVLTPSMEPEIGVGDLIIFTHNEISEVQAGDDIVFVAGNGFDWAIQGQNVVHRVREVTTENGEISIITYGINNANDDLTPVSAENFVGICIYHSAGWGAFFSFMMRYGVIILIAVVALPFIVKQIIKIVKLSREKEEDDK